MEPLKAARGHTTYIDGKMLSVTIYNFQIYFQLSACAMIQAELHNSSVAGMADIPSAEFIFNKDQACTLDVEVVCRVGEHQLIILTRGMGERLTYGILARYCVVLVECLGGLFFDGRHSCIRDSFAGHSGLYRGDSLVVSIYLFVCESWLAGFKLECTSLSNGIPILATAFVR